MKAIIVNGTSSAGCTSFVEAFQALVGNDRKAVYMDRFLRDLPPRMWERCSDSDEGWAEIGMAFSEYLAELVREGQFVIADGFYKLPSAIDHLFDVLRRDSIFFVQLYCELAELERREQARSDRKKGLARSQFEQMYSFKGYDLLIDSTSLSVQECVQKLIREVPNQTLESARAY